jgi:hypothetical protein
LVYVLGFAGVGVGFMLAAPALDPDLGTVGLILVVVAGAMLAIYLALAYRAFRRRGPRPPECTPDH